MQRAGHFRSISALLACACLAFFAAGLISLPAQQARDAAVARLVTLERMAADSDMVLLLLRRAEAEIFAARQGDAYRLAEVATTQALLAEAIARLAEGAVGEPVLRPHVGAIGVLVRLRMESPGDGTPENLAAPPIGRAQLQAAGLAADQLAVISAQRELMERQTVLHSKQRLDIAGMAVVIALVALAAAMVLGWRSTRPDAHYLREARAALGLLQEDGPVGLGLLNRDLVFVEANPRLMEILARGQPAAREVRGLHLTEVAPELAPLVVSGPFLPVRTWPMPVGCDVLRSWGGGARPGPSVSATIELPPSRPGSSPAHWFVGLRQIAGAGGRPAALSVVVIDVSESIRAESEREILVRELNHRVKNAFATMQAVAAQTLRTAGRDFDRFGRDFMGRLMALARSHDLVSAQGFGPVSLADVAAVALEPFRASGQIAIAGAADVTVRPAQAQALVVALYELGANAAQYGALLRPEGRVTLGWDFGTDSLGVRLIWTERGGPEIAAPPARRGFGLRVLERALAHDLGPGASVDLCFDSAGFCCNIQFEAAGIPVRAAA